MSTDIHCDPTTLMMIGMLREHDAHEPPEPDNDTMNEYQLAEAAMRHYEWSKMRYATWLMLAARLVSQALDQVSE